MSNIRNLEPKQVWNYFHEITQIPHPSKKEKKLVEYMKAFGKQHNLDTTVDKVGNVIMRKPATKGMEKRKRDAFLEDLLAATSPEYLKSVREARADYKAKRVKTHGEVFGK